MENYNPHGAPEDFNPRNPNHQYDIDMWDMPIKAFISDIHPTDLSQLKLRQKKPR